MCKTCVRVVRELHIIIIILQFDRAESVSVCERVSEENIIILLRLYPLMQQQQKVRAKILDQL